MLISVLSTLMMILLFFFSGKIFESIKRLFTLTLSLFMKLLQKFGINISKKEKQVKLSDEFKNTFGDIRLMKKSKQNLTMKKSINTAALIIFVLSVSLIILNLQVVSDNAISLWLFEHNLFPMIIVTQQNMDITFTATTFSILSFSSSTLYKQWKDTKDSRIAKKQIRQKKRLMDLMTSKEMLDLSRQKDSEKLKEVLPSMTGDEGEKENV